MDIERFDRATCKAMWTAIKLVLQAVTEKYGLELELAPGSFTADSFRIPMTLHTKPTNGQSREQAEFTKLCSLFHLTPEHYWREFRYRNQTYRPVSVNPSRSKFCLRGRRILDNKLFLFPTDALRHIDAQVYEQHFKPLFGRVAVPGPTEA